MVAGAAFLWGTLGLYARFLYAEGLSVETVVFYRALFSLLGSATWAAAIDRRLLRVRPGDLPFFALYGLVSVTAFYLLYFRTIRETTVAMAAVLLYTAPAFVILLARALYREPLTPWKLAALGVALPGVVLVSDPLDPGTSVTPLGVALGLASGLTYALYSIFAKRALRGYRPPTVVLYSVTFGTAFLLAASPPWELEWSFHPRVWAVLVAVGLVPTTVAFMLYSSGLSRLEAGVASIVATVEPVFAAVSAYLFLGETLTGAQAAGGALVLLGAVLAACGEWGRARRGPARGIVRAGVEA